MRALLLMAALLLPGVAGAQSGMLLLGVGAQGVGYTGPGDITSFTAWWGLRSYRASYCTGSNAAGTIRRASDNATQVINITTACAFDVAAATTFCNATTCFFTQLNDQTGGGQHVVQATAANQPQLIFNCLNTSLPCMEGAVGSVMLQTSANFTPASGIVSFSIVGNRVSASSSPALFIAQGSSTNRFGPDNTSNTFKLIGGASGTLTKAANSNAWHAANAVINGASSVLNVDGGTEATGTVTGNTTAGKPLLLNPFNPITVRQAEGGFTDNVAWSAGTRTAICHNQFLYWATSTSC